MGCVLRVDCRCLLDRVQTHITALLEMTTFYSRDNYRPSMAVWMTIAVPLLANLYEPTDAKKLEVLAQMLHRLEILSLWVALAGVHWGRVVTILYTGEPQQLDPSLLQVSHYMLLGGTRCRLQHPLLFI